MITNASGVKYDVIYKVLNKQHSIRSKQTSAQYNIITNCVWIPKQSK